MSGNTRLAVRLVAGLAIAATLVCGVALNAWRTRAEPLPSAMRRHSRAEAVPTPVPAPPEVPPEQAQEQASWASSWMSSWNPFSSGNTAELQMVGHPVGTWRPGDPWPGGVECASGKLADAFHMKPDRGCEPNCEQCQMVCLPSAFVGPFKNHGGEIGSNCFERGCSKYVGDGSRSGVQFFMFDCDPALQKEWAETNAVMTEDEVHQKLTECLAMCKSRDQACKLTCEATHKDELAEITLRMHAAAGFKGEHGDAYQTATVMGFILMCAVIAGIAGCFSIHAHHTTKDGKASKPPSKGAIAPSHTTNAMHVQIEGKVIQIATGTDGQLCALTDDGRVYAWTADDAAKARGALEAALVEGGVGDSVPAADTGAKPAAKASSRAQPQTPTRPATAYSEKMESPLPKSPSATVPRGNPRGAKQSISELKKSVNTIRAVN